jgi:parvulin-like peptidyl-prolyl isomerase
MGDAFEKAMQTAEIDTWTGLIASGFGVHLVKISQRTKPQMPNLDQVRPEVLRDYQYDKEKEIGNQLYLEIRKKYPIQIELEPFDAINQEFIDKLEQKISE